LFLPIPDIFGCEADVNYTVFHFVARKKVMVSRTLKEYDELLNEFDFLRVHQSHLVNREHISVYIKGDGGYLVLTDQTSVPVARSRKEAVLKRLNEF